MSSQLTNKNYSADTQKQVDRSLKASYTTCSISDRKLFPQSTCIIPISMAETREFEERDDRRFKATFQLVSATFKYGLLLIGDTLHRHTLRISYPNDDESALYQRSKKIGDLWIERNQSVFQNSTMPYKFQRWDDYLNHPHFAKQYERVATLYETNKDYQAQIHLNAEEYLKRYTTSQFKRIDFDYQKAFQACVAYLKEECAIMCLWAEGGYSFEVYPSGRCCGMTATYEHLIEPIYPDLLKPVGLRFKKRVHQNATQSK